MSGQFCEFKSLLVKGLNLADSIPTDTSKRVELAEEWMHKSLGSLSRTEDVLLVNACFACLFHAEQRLQLCLCYRLSLLLFDHIKHQEMFFGLELVLQAIEVDCFLACLGLSYSKRAMEETKTGLSLLVFPADVELL